MQNTYTLTNCTVLTVDKEDRFYPNGRVVVSGKNIISAGPAATTPITGEAIDMDGALVMPGLVNTHTYSHSTLFRGQADDVPLMEWLQKAMWPMEAHLNAERSYAATALSCIEYIRGGITTYADQFYFAEQTANAATASGLRCYLAVTVFDKSSPETDDTLGAAKQFVEKWHGKDEQTRVTPCIGPHAPYSVSAHQWQQVVALSEQYNLLIHTHISETADENRQLQEQTGLTPTAWLESLGVFNRPVLAAHSIHLSDADLDIYAKYGVCVSYNPVSNMKLASGIMPLGKMRERGISVGIGTDGAQSNNTLDLLRDLRTGTLLQKLANSNAAFINAREAVRMATIEGARVLRSEAKFGSIEEGKYADLIAIDTNSVRLTPLHREDLSNLYAAVCYAACGADVRDVVVDGQFVMRGGTIQTFDETEVRKSAQAASVYLVQHAGIQ